MIYLFIGTDWTLSMCHPFIEYTKAPQANSMPRPKDKAYSKKKR